jgi:hypothetical protein
MNLLGSCPCGSGRPSWWENDARGIPLARVCEKCKDEKLSKFRPEVLTDPNYETDEPVEPELDDVGNYDIYSNDWES